MTFYYGLQKTADKLLKSKGQALVITRTVQGSYNPDSGAVINTTSTQEGFGAVFDYGTRSIDGTLIRAGDKQLLLSALDASGVALTAPCLGDTVTIGGVVYVLVEPLKTISPAGTVVMYECNIRGVE